MDPEKLEASLTEAKTRITELEGELKELTQINEDMQSQIDELTETAKTAPGPRVVKLGKKKFQVNLPKFRLGADKVLSADDLDRDEELVKAVLEIKGQGILTPVK